MKIENLVHIGQKAVQDQFGETLPKYKLELAIKKIFEAIGEISLTEDVTIYNFGTFTRSQVKERTIETNFTRQPVTIEQHLKPRFKPAKVLKSKFRYNEVV